MKQYKGYYIDHVYFNSEADIDAHIKQQAIDGYKIAMQVFYHNMTMEASIYCSKLADRLHDMFGLNWDEIEDIELSVL